MSPDRDALVVTARLQVAVTGVQPVDVVLDGRLWLRRRDGRWGPAPPGVAPAVGAAAVLAAVAAVLPTAAAALRRARTAADG